MFPRVLDKHIEITPGIAGGKPRIAGRRITVQNIVIWHERLGKSADEISSEYDLPLASVYAALAYYFDHVVKINKSIKEGEAFAEQMRKEDASVLSQRPMGLHPMKLSDEAVAESIRPLSDEDLGFWQDNDFPK